MVSHYSAAVPGVLLGDKQETIFGNLSTGLNKSKFTG